MSIVAGALASLALAVLCNGDLGPRWSSPWRFGSAAVLAAAAAADALSFSVEDTVLVVMLALPAIACALWLSNGLTEAVARWLHPPLRMHVSPAAHHHRAALREAYFHELTGGMQTPIAPRDAGDEAAHFNSETIDIEDELRALLSERLGREQPAEPAHNPVAIDAPWWIVLDLSPHASMTEIAARYRARLKQYHPDRVNGLAPELVSLAERRTKDLNRAFEEAKREAAAPA